MSNWKEINDAIKIFKKNKKKLTIFQCTSQYPCVPRNVGINVLEELKKYNCDIGLSDHTEGYAASISAIAKGCNVIEKHITFSKKMYGSDAKHSMEPQDFKIFCKELKEAYLINSTTLNKDNLNYLKKMRFIFQKSIYTSKDIKKGSKLTLECIAFLKPGDGILASDYKKVVGKIINKNLKKNYKLTMKDFIK
jgi:N-acetylneuraminate synthase